MASSAAAPTVKVLEVRKVAPEPAPSNPFSLPLTFFDAFWIKLPPVERIFLYQVPDLSPSTFRSHLLPNLIRSLSFTLRHFLPLAGNVVWPSDAAVPVVLYNPGDAVSTTVAESSEDFDRISDDGEREASDSLVYVPELIASDSAASILSLQITLFPNRGFCIGVTAHHGILDGKTQSMFMKAWSHTCRQIGDEDDSVNFPPPLPESLTPVFDRSRIVNSEEISVEYLDDWFRFRLKLPNMDPNSNPRSLELLWSLVDNDSKRLRATFDFSKQRIKKLKEELIPKSPNPNYLSSFVLTLAHTLVCLTKAKATRGGGAIQGAFSADFRSRLDPPVPENFFGNCVLPFEVFLTEAEAAEGGVGFAAGKIVEAIKEVEKGAMEGAKGRLAKFLFPDAGRFGVIGTAGSPRLGMYGVDFGCGGRPRKVEVASTARTGAISMAESRDGSGGFEVGVVLNKEEMDVFRAAFVE